MSYEQLHFFLGSLRRYVEVDTFRNREDLRYQKKMSAPSPPHACVPAYALTLPVKHDM